MRIYYGSLELTKIIETPQFTFETTLSEFGGTLSLWLGICLAGVLEFVELFLRIIAVFFTSMKRPCTILFFKKIINLVLEFNKYAHFWLIYKFSKKKKKHIFFQNSSQFLWGLNIWCIIWLISFRGQSCAWVWRRMQKFKSQKEGIHFSFHSFLSSFPPALPLHHQRNWEE